MSIHDVDGEFRFINLYWHKEIECWQLLGAYKTIEESEESRRKWKSKGTERIRTYHVAKVLEQKPKRDCYPDGLFEFDCAVRDEEGNPPAMVRLRLGSRYQVYGLLTQLISMLAIADRGGGIDCLAFSGELKEVDE